MEFNNNIISFLLSPPAFNWLFSLRILLTVFTFIFLVMVIILLVKTTWIKYNFGEALIEFFTFRTFKTKKLTKKWKKITARLKTDNESEYKLAVIEADALFDDVLKNMGFSGESLGERLKKLTPALLSNLEEVWQAHKIRNNIVHDSDYRLTLNQTQKTLNTFEKALSNLELL